MLGGGTPSASLYTDRSFPRRPRVKGDHCLSLLRDNYISTPAVVTCRGWVFREVGGRDAAALDWTLYLLIARRFPIRSYDKAAVEYRWPVANMTGDAALMPGSNVSCDASIRSMSRTTMREQRHELGEEDTVSCPGADVGKGAG